MKQKFFLLTIAMAVVLGMMTPAFSQGATKPGPNISQDEAAMAQKIQAAPDAAGKMKAAGEFIKKYPKTAIRSQVAQEIGNRIQDVTDPTQKLALAQEYQTIFNDPAEEGIVGPVIIDALADANQLDQAFTKGSDFLSRHPESLRVLIELLSIGTDQAKKQNGKYIDQSIRFGVQAIALAEANKKPADFDEASWQNFKTRTVPSIYQSLGLLHMVKGSRSDAKANYTKASQALPSDPFNFVMLAAIANDEYRTEADAYQKMAAGAEKDAQLKKVEGLLDAVIDTYARAIALSDGNATLAQVRQQYLQDLEHYYKYRHNNSTEGMQQLIDKYKVAPKP